VEEKMNFLTPWRVTASSRFTPPATLVRRKYRLATDCDQSFGGEMHHGVNLVLGEDGFNLGAIPDLPGKRWLARHGGTMAFH